MSENESSNEQAIPFDLYADLEDAYDKAGKDGETEITETLDAFGLWDESEKLPAKQMLCAWQAINGDVAQQRELAWCFDWSSEPQEERNRRFDRPRLAIYWYEKAAEAGDALAQCNLGCIYCSDEDVEIWNGHRGVYWREKATAQKVPEAMLGLADCLDCGRCCKGGVDLVRAKALREEAEKVKREKGEEK